jgi:hypothetical protein
LSVIDKVNWTEIFEDINNSPIPNMTHKNKYTGRKEFDVDDTLRKKRLII